MMSSKSRISVSLCRGFKWLCIFKPQRIESEYSVQLKTQGQVIVMTAKYLGLLNPDNDQLILELAWAG